MCLCLQTFWPLPVRGLIFRRKRRQKGRRVLLLRLALLCSFCGFGIGLLCRCCRLCCKFNGQAEGGKMCRNCVSDKLDGMRKCGNIRGGRVHAKTGGIFAGVVKVAADVGDARAVNVERCNAARGICAGVYFDSLHGCLCLGVVITRKFRR